MNKRFVKSQRTDTPVGNSRNALVYFWLLPWNADVEGTAPFTAEQLRAFAGRQGVAVLTTHKEK